MGSQLYHIDVVNTDMDRRVRQTAYPMTRRECEVMASKMTPYTWRKIELVPVPDPIR